MGAGSREGEAGRRKGPRNEGGRGENRSYRGEKGIVGVKGTMGSRDRREERMKGGERGAGKRSPDRLGSLSFAWAFWRHTFLY